MSPSLCIRPSPWIPAFLRISMKPCTHRQFHILSVTFVMVKDAKSTALHPTVSCHQGLATAEPGTVLCKTWPGRDSQVRLVVGGGGMAEAVQSPQVNSLGSPGVVSFDSPPPLPPLLTSLLPPSSLLTPTPLSPFLGMLIMYHSIPRSTCG